jgi:hypothetical protein
MLEVPTRLDDAMNSRDDGGEVGVQGGVLEVAGANVRSWVALLQSRRW